MLSYLKVTVASKHTLFTVCSSAKTKLQNEVLKKQSFRTKFWCSATNLLKIMAVKIWSCLCVLVSLNYGLADPVHSCPDVSGMFNGVIDQFIEGPNLLVDDPELTFFKEVLGFRDDDIQHAFDDAVKFFNETYGLDFSLSPPNDLNEVFFENARMRPVRFRDDVHYTVVFNNWIKAGNTRTTCSEIQVGRFEVGFSGDQLLYGSYGGESEVLVGAADSVVHGFVKVNVCDQSPVIVQIQSTTPFRMEPLDGTSILNLDLYNNVLGYGRALGAFIIKPVPDRPGIFHVFSRTLFTF